MQVGHPVTRPLILVCLAAAALASYESSFRMKCQTIVQRFAYPID